VPRQRCHKTQSTFITQQCCAVSFSFCTTKFLYLLVLLLCARMRNPLNILQCWAYKVEQFTYSRTGRSSEATKITRTATLQRKPRDSSLHGTRISTNAVPMIGQIPKCKPNVCTQVKEKSTHGAAIIKQACRLNKEENRASLIKRVPQHCCWNFSQTSTSISEVFLRPARLILCLHL